MQGARAKLNRLGTVASLVALLAGMFLGGALLAVLLTSVRAGLRDLYEGPTDLQLSLVVVVLLLGDLWAIARNKVYPVGLRRQTSKQLMDDPRWREWNTWLVWGVDAGTGVTTYRVTSGVWVLSLLVVSGRAEAWVVFAYAAGFGASFLAYTLWPLRPRAVGDDYDEYGAMLGRARRVSSKRRHIQLLYLLLVLTIVPSLQAA